MPRYVLAEGGGGGVLKVVPRNIESIVDKNYRNNMIYFPGNFAPAYVENVR